MNPADHWLQRYAEHHTHRVNRILHVLCIPLLLAAVVGALWSLPVPARFSESSPALNWGTLFLMAVIVYYFILSVTLALGMLPFILLIAALVSWLDSLATPLWLISAVTLAVAGSGQMIGHAFERARVSLIADLNLVAIGPLWLLAGAYQRLRIPY